MASSAKYLKAIATKKIVARSTTSGEVHVVFKSTMRDGVQVQPKSILLTARPLDVLGRSDVTLDDVKRSNLDQLVARGVADLEL